MGKTLNVSHTYAKAHSALGMIALSTGGRPWQTAMNLLERCYLNGRDYTVELYDSESNTYLLRELKPYMPAPYAHDDVLEEIAWMGHEERALHKDVLRGAALDMEALDTNHPLLACMLLQYEVLTSGGKLAIPHDY